MLKLSDNPPVRPKSLASVRDAADPWWVGHTKARAEKAFAWDLIAKGIPHFLPMAPKTTFSGGRKRHGMTPLFTGYVFFSGDAEARYQALATDRLCGVIPVKEQAAVVDELAAIELALEAGEALDLYPELAVGKTCRVARGPMAGVVGTVVSRDDVTRLVLRVSVLGTGAAIAVEPSFLEAVE